MVYLIVSMYASFLQLKPPMSAGEMPINTILLCASNETSLDELKSTCEQTSKTRSLELKVR